MPGDRWQRFAQLRAYYALMYTHPGKKLLFMGTEFAQEREWNSDISLDWHLLGDPMHLGVQRLVRDLNALYRSIASTARARLRAGRLLVDRLQRLRPERDLVPQTGKRRQGERSPSSATSRRSRARTIASVFPRVASIAERLNSDAAAYGGANIGNEGGVEAAAEPMHGRPFSLALKLPPFATVVLEHEGRRTG